MVAGATVLLVARAASGTKNKDRSVFRTKCNVYQVFKQAMTRTMEKMRLNLSCALLTLLFGAAGTTASFASASEVGKSAIYVNENWYYAGENLGWCSGGAFNGANLGTLTSLKLAGQSKARDSEWGEGATMSMCYMIDGGISHTLTLTKFGYENGYNKFQSGGADFAPETIDISGLAGGEHTLSVYFYSDGIYDSNNSQNYNAKFYVEDESWGKSDYRDTSWGEDYSTSTTFTIRSLEQLAQFAYMVNNGSDFSGKTVVLEEAQEGFHGQVFTNSIYNIQEHPWVPIGTPEKPFNGTFDGNGNTIAFVNVTGASYLGFFGYIGTSGSVSDLCVHICKLNGSTQVGGLVGYNGGTIENCLVTDVTITGASYVGTIIGQNAGSATSCYAIASYGKLAVGESSNATGHDVSGQAECLWSIEGLEDGEGELSLGYSADETDKDAWVSSGESTGQEVGDAVFCTDGIQYNYYHYYKSGATATITSYMDGYDVTFAVSGEGASIDGNTITVGTGDVVVSIASKTAASWSGSGTEEDPYLIANREQMTMLANYVNSGNGSGEYFQLTDYLKYSVSSEGTYDYYVVGTSEHPFEGTFDGNGYSIDYAWNAVAADYQGLFGYIGEMGTVKNLSASGCDFKGRSYTGIIAGRNDGVIENCRVDNFSTVIFDSANPVSYCGGVVGCNNGSIMTTVCAANIIPDNADYTSATQMGGIAGYNGEAGVIENCLYLGKYISGTTYVGAIAGQAFDAELLMGNYYHNNDYRTTHYFPENVGTTVLGVGSESGSSDADGAKLAKLVRMPAGGTFSNPYGVVLDAEPIFVTTSNPNGFPLSVYEDGLLFDDSYLGGEKGNTFYTTASTVELAAGDNMPDGLEAIFSCEDDESGEAYIDGTTLYLGDHTEEVTVKVTFNMVPGTNSWLNADNRAEAFSTIGDNTITITSAAELGLLAYNANFEEETYEGYTILLGADLDLSAHTWESIGESSTGMVAPIYGASGFLGSFDGQGHTISGMYPASLFAKVASGATVQNLTVADAAVEGSAYVGIIAGRCSGVITNCHVVDGSLTFMEVEGGMEYPISNSVYGILFGGIAGMCEGGTISGCTVRSTTIGTSMHKYQYIGGIVGGISPARTSGESESSTTLRDCLFEGTLLKGDGSEGYGSIAGISYGEVILANNFYVGSEIGGIEDADVTDGNGAVLGYAWSYAPEGIGDAGTAYGTGDFVGVTPYENGLLYDGIYYYAEAPTAIDLSDTEDNSDILEANNGLTVDVTLQGRTLWKDGSWNTICLPFDVDLTDEDCPLYGDGVTAKTLAEGSVEGTTLTLTFGNAVTTLSAGVPYIIKWTKPSTYTAYDGSNADQASDIVNPMFPAVVIKNELHPVEQDDIDFVGSYAPVAIGEEGDNTKLFLGADDKLFWPNSEMTIGAQRAIFQLKNDITAGSAEVTEGIKAFVLNFGDEETGICEITTPSNLSNFYYTLDGVRLNGQPTATGLYISKGKKVMIK